MVALFKRSKMRILTLAIIVSFVSFCLYSIFEFDNLEIGATETQEEIIITISNNTQSETNTDSNNLAQNITNNKNLAQISDIKNDASIKNDALINNELELKENNSNTTKTPFLNPLLLDYCQNAILNNDKFEITAAISEAASKCDVFNGVYTREGLDAYRNSSCPYNRQSIRTHELVMQYIKTNGNLHDNHIRGINTTNAYHEWYKKFPIYYMIPKAGSSTTHKVLSFTNKYGHVGRIIGERIGFENMVNPSDCAFTLVRNPVERLISGYYTINVHLWRFVKGGFFNLYNESIRKPGNVWNYMYVKYEPERFRTFVEELITEPNKFTLSGGNEHIISAASILSSWVGINRQNSMNYIGKVENYPGDMHKIMRRCEYFNERDINLVEDDRRSHEMHGFGWHSPSSWVAEFEKYGNWVEWMSLFPLLHHWIRKHNVDNVLPPAYYAIDQVLYEKIVNYYIQDIVCFDYKKAMTFENFKAKRDTFLNIYEMYANYSTTENTTVLP